MNRSITTSKRIRHILCAISIIVFGILVADARAVSVQPQALWTGKVVAVTDGDTIKVLTNNEDTIKIRIYGIDAPEKKQKHGPESKQYLSDLVFHKAVSVCPLSVDIYGRTIARLYVENIDVGETMVCSGNAWWYKQYAKKDMRLSRCEKKARLSKAGLWSQEKPVAPWEFRKKN